MIQQWWGQERQEGDDMSYQEKQSLAATYDIIKVKKQLNMTWGWPSMTLRENLPSHSIVQVGSTIYRTVIMKTQHKHGQDGW